MIKTWWNRSSDTFLPILIALVFLAFTFSYYPFRQKIQYDTDEGLNVMRSMLVVLGHPLYSEVSSDQPPLFTHLLGLVFRVAGFEVNPARLFVLLFSTLLVWSGAQFLQLIWGKLAAIAFLPLMIMVPRYLDLSVAVMIGVPCIALAAVSMLFVTLWHQQKKILWLILSAFILAFSVLIKLFTGFLVPIFLIGITISEYFDTREEGFSWKALRPALIWSICFGGVAVLLGLILIGPQNLKLLISPSLEAGAQEVFQSSAYTINTHLQAAVPLLILGYLGTLVSIYKRKWLMLYPLAWAAVAYTLFSFYSPVFYHHQLLITIPAAIMAAAAIGDGILSLIHSRKFSTLISLPNILGIVSLAGFVWVSISVMPALDKKLLDSPRLSGFRLQGTAGKMRLLSMMTDYVDQTNWIVTDMPMYAFRVHRPVPPILATFSLKRLTTGSLTDQDILTAMREYQPEQVLVARFEIPALEEYLKDHYTLILSEEDYFRLFLRNDIQLSPN